LTPDATGLAESRRRRGRGNASKNGDIKNFFLKIQVIYFCHFAVVQTLMQKKLIIEALK
jgi:hypothetical protein